MFSSNLSRNYYNSTTLGKHIFNPKLAVKIRNTYRATLTAHILRQGSHLFVILQGMLTRLHVCKSEWSFQTAIRTCWHLRRWMGRLTFFFFSPQLSCSLQICLRYSVKWWHCKWTQRLFESSYAGHLQHFIYKATLPTQSVEWQRFCQGLAITLCSLHSVQVFMQS